MRGRGAGCRRAQPRSLAAQSRRPPAGPGCRGPGAQARWLRSRRSAALRPGPASACDARRAGREQDTQGERGAGARRGRGRWTGRSGAAGPATCAPRRCPHSRRRSSRFASPASEKTPEVAVPGDGRDTRSPGGGGASQRPLRHRRPRGPARPASLAAPRVPCAKCRVRTRPLRKRGFHGAQLRGSRSPPTTAALRWAFLAPRDGTEGDEDPRSDIIRGQLWGKMRREAVARAEPRVGAGSDGFKGTQGFKGTPGA